ncbi:Ndc80 [Carabus blaptoides fortunei]
MYSGKTSISRLPVKTNLLEVPGTLTRDSRSRSRASSTSRVSGLATDGTPAFRRSKSSQSLYKTPQSVLRSARQRSTDRPKHKKKESRPLHDKKWQQQQIAKTQAYFQTVPGGCDILNKGTNLRPITLNMFVELTNLVLSNIDPCLNELRLANYTDLLPSYLNMLMYPGVVTVSMLKTANTMHSWPHVLGILSWLVEFEQLHNSPVEDIVFEIPDDAPPEFRTIKYCWGMVVDTFTAWNSKELDENLLMKNYEEGIKMIYDVPANEANNLQEKINKKGEYYSKVKEKVEERRNRLKASQEELDMMKTDIHKAKSIYSQQINYNNRINDVIVDSKNDIDRLKKEIEKLQKNNMQLTEKVAKQTMTRREREEHLSVIEDLKAKQTLVQNTRAHQQQISDEKDLKLSQLKRRLEQKTNAYNINLMKPTLTYPALKELSLPQDAFIRPDQISTKIQKKKALKTQLMQDHEDLVSKINILKTKVENKQKELDDLLVSKDKKKRTNEELKIKINNMQKMGHTQDRITQSKIEQRKDQIKELSNAVQNPDYKKLAPILETHVEQCKWWEKRMEENGKEFVDFFQSLENQTDNHISKLVGFRNKIDKNVNKTIDIFTNPKAKKDSEEFKKVT